MEVHPSATGSGAMGAIVNGLSLAVAEATLSQVGFNVNLAPLSLSPLSVLPFLQLAAQHLFQRAIWGIFGMCITYPVHCNWWWVIVEVILGMLASFPADPRMQVVQISAP